MTAQRLGIERLGQRGEGVASLGGRSVYVPYALPGDRVLADVDGELGHLVTIEAPRPDRIAPICPVFTICGGCAVQALPPTDYRDWKRSLVADVLGKAGVEAPVLPLVDAHGEGRRRVTVHARHQPTPNVLSRRDLRVGFMRARSHEVIDLERCPILAPGLTEALPAARALSEAAADLGKPLDLVITATRSGLDVDLRGLGPLPEPVSRRLVDVATRLPVARLSNHGDVLVERRPPMLTMGEALVTMPPGGFLQATEAGEEALAREVLGAVGTARRVADLFCGLGTFALRLASAGTVLAVDNEGPALATLARAARNTPALRPLTTQARDLFRQPLTPDELARFDAVVFDPPRAGALAQAQALASSKVPTVVAVSCNPATFSRDSAVLIAGGYRLERVVPIDQFRYAPHVELVGTFRRPKAKRARPLFG